MSLYWLDDWINKTREETFLTEFQLLKVEKMRKIANSNKKHSNCCWQNSPRGADWVGEILKRNGIYAYPQSIFPKVFLSYCGSFNLVHRFSSGGGT